MTDELKELQQAEAKARAAVGRWPSDEPPEWWAQYASVIWVSAETWHCPFCEPDGGDGAGTTVTWLDGSHDGPDGRCGKCGVKLVLARAGEHVPDPLEQQQRWAPE